MTIFQEISIHKIWPISHPHGQAMEPFNVFGHHSSSVVELCYQDCDIVRIHRISTPCSLILLPGINKPLVSHQYPERLYVSWSPLSSVGRTPCNGPTLLYQESQLSRACSECVQGIKVEIRSPHARFHSTSAILICKINISNIACVF